MPLFFLAKLACCQLMLQMVPRYPIHKKIDLKTKPKQYLTMIPNVIAIVMSIMIMTNNIIIKMTREPSQYKDVVLPV